MKRFVTGLLVLIMLLSVLVCVNAEEKYGPIMQNIFDTGKFQVATIGNRPPYNYHKLVGGDDVLCGFEVEMLKAVAEKLSEYFGKEIELVITETDAQGALAAVQAGKVHTTLGFTATAERKENYDFTIPYHRSLQCIVVRVDELEDPKFAAERELEGVTVASEMGSSNMQFLMEQFPKADIVLLGSRAELVVQVLNKKTDAALITEKSARLYCKANPALTIAEWLTYDIPVEADPGASFVAQKGNEDYIEWMDAYLGVIIEDGTFKSFEQKALIDLDDPELLAQYEEQNLFGDATKK